MSLVAISFDFLDLSCCWCMVWVKYEVCKMNKAKIKKQMHKNTTISTSCIGLLLFLKDKEFYMLKELSKRKRVQKVMMINRMSSSDSNLMTIYLGELQWVLNFKTWKSIKNSFQIFYGIALSKSCLSTFHLILVFKIAIKNKWSTIDKLLPPYHTHQFNPIEWRIVVLRKEAK